MKKVPAYKAPSCLVDKYIGSDLDKILQVADNLKFLQTILDALPRFEDVKQDIGFIQSVAGDLKNIDAVAKDLGNIDIVAGATDDIKNIYGDIAYIKTVASKAVQDTINSIRNALDPIKKVGEAIEDIKAVRADLTNIDVVADPNYKPVIEKASKLKDTLDILKNHEKAITDIGNNITPLQNVGSVYQQVSKLSEITQQIKDLAPVASNIQDLDTQGKIELLTNIFNLLNTIGDLNTFQEAITIAKDLQDAIKYIYLPTTQTAFTLIQSHEQDLTIIANLKDDIPKVASIKGDVTQVALLKNAIEKIANNWDDLKATVDKAEAIVTDKDNINLVAGAINNIQTIIDNLNYIQTVASMPGLPLLAFQANAVQTLGDEIDTLRAIASDIANINTVASRKDALDTFIKAKPILDKVDDIVKEVQQVIGIQNSINAILDLEKNKYISTVASIATPIQNVSPKVEQFGKIGDNITNMNKIADNVDDILKITSVSSDFPKFIKDIDNINTVAGLKKQIDWFGEDAKLPSGDHVTNGQALAGIYNTTWISYLAYYSEAISKLVNNPQFGNIVTLSQSVDAVNAIGKDSNIIAGIKDLNGHGQDLKDLSPVADVLGELRGKTEVIKTLPDTVKSINDIKTEIEADVPVIKQAVTDSTNSATSASNSLTAIKAIQKDVTDVQTKVESDKTETKTYKDDAEKSAQEAKKASSDAITALNSTYVAGGVFTPTSKTEYPDLTKFSNKDVLFIISLDHVYTFTSGDFVGKVANSGDQMVYMNSDSKWHLINMPTVGQSLLQQIYPVNSLYISLDSRNPKDILGFGSWRAIDTDLTLRSGSKFSPICPVTGSPVTNVSNTPTVPLITHTHTGKATSTGSEHSHDNDIRFYDNNDNTLLSTAIYDSDKFAIDRKVSQGFFKGSQTMYFRDKSLHLDYGTWLHNRNDPDGGGNTVMAILKTDTNNMTRAGGVKSSGSGHTHSISTNAPDGAVSQGTTINTRGNYLCVYMWKRVS